MARSPGMGRLAFNGSLFSFRGSLELGLADGLKVGLSPMARFYRLVLSTTLARSNTWWFSDRWARSNQRDVSISMARSRDTGLLLSIGSLNDVGRLT